MASTLIMVVLTFAAASWGHLVVVAVVMAIIIYMNSENAGSIWRLIWMLKWLLLFTLLLHLLFTPGRTLWGTTWLSYDGMLVGLFICMQLTLAVLLASIMALTTSVEDLVGSLGWMLSPLARAGVDTAGWEKMILLAMNFIPVVHAQIEQSGVECADDDTSGQVTEEYRWMQWGKRLKSFALNLVERADKVAHELISEDDNRNPSSKLAPLVPLTLLDKLFVLSLSMIVFGYWLAGRLA